jgi:hypothetical protein
MHVNFSLAPLVALLAGILILVMPRLLNYIVAIYLIVTGCSACSAAQAASTCTSAPHRPPALRRLQFQMPFGQPKGFWRMMV